MTLTTNYATSELKNVRRAANRGSSSAQLEMALRLFRGRGVERNPFQAFAWCEASAGNGCVAAHNVLGCCYALGLGVRADSKAAYRHFDIAARKGDARAMYNLACCYIAGRGVKQNERSACKWLLASARRGYKKARVACGAYLALNARDDAERELARAWIERVM